MSGPRVEVHIGELALTGVAPHERDVVAAALRAELTRALGPGARTAPVAPRAPLTVDAAPGGGAAALGAAAARALARGLEG